MRYFYYLFIICFILCLLFVYYVELFNTTKQVKYQINVVKIAQSELVWGCPYTYFFYFFFKGERCLGHSSISKQ